MKKLILIILFLGTAKAFAQYPIINDSIKKSGIYRTFEEFRDNNPSILIDFKNSKFKIDAEDRDYGRSYHGVTKSIKVYGLNVSETAARNMGYIFGFCDGEKMYLSVETERYSNYMNFYEVNFLGGICYYEFLPNSINDVKNRAFIVNAKTINLKTGKFDNLSKKYMLKLLTEKPELLKRFESERNQTAVLKEYLKEYLNN